MTNQIFKDPIPNHYVFDLLDKIHTFKSKNYYTIDTLSYKKGIYNKDIEQFLDLIRPHYHASKQFYIDRNMTFPRFTTIIRQICKANNISFTSQIKYDKSKYNIIYYVYF